jgi:hypothetical protein
MKVDMRIRSGPKALKIHIEPGLQSTPLNPLAEAVEWMDLDPRCPSV